MPSPVKSSETNQPLADCWSIAAVAPLMSLPITWAGARTYLALPRRSQVTSRSVAKSPLAPPVDSTLEQSRLLKAASCSGVRDAPCKSVASSGVGTAHASTNTCLKRSSAVCPTKSTILLPVSPGTEITI